MELALPEGCADVAFSNWLLMYLGDSEVQQLARNMLGWVRAPRGGRLGPAGVLLLRCCS